MKYPVLFHYSCVLNIRDFTSFAMAYQIRTEFDWTERDKKRRAPCLMVLGNRKLHSTGKLVILTFAL